MTKRRKLLSRASRRGALLLAAGGLGIVASGAQAQTVNQVCPGTATGTNASGVTLSPGQLYYGTVESIGAMGSGVGGAGGPVTWSVAVPSADSNAGSGFPSAPVVSLGGMPTPQSAVWWAQSMGGCGHATSSPTSAGGAGGAVSVSVESGRTATQPSWIFQVSNNAAGIVARSAGGQGGAYL